MQSFRINYILIFSIFLIGCWSLPLVQVSAQCSFTPSTTSECGQIPIEFFVDNPDTLSIYSWDFDGLPGFETEGDSVAYIFPGSGTLDVFTVTLYQDSVACATQDISIFSAPDASIGDVGGDFVICSNAQQTATLDIFNASLTFPINTEYIIEWGDGTADTLDNNTFDPATPVSHTYTTFGFYDITVSVTADGSVSCNTSSRNYTFYYGSNPAVGFNSNGNTVGLCAPATIDFPITNTNNNSDGTLYEVFVNGELIDVYNHPPPPNFTFTFQETSCDLVTANGLFTSAYDVRIRATNPCASTSLTVEPIELSSPPIPMIEVAQADQLCPDDPVVFTNTTENIAEVEAGVCSASGLTQWTLSPNDGWQVVNGSLFNSDVIEVVFDSAGVYSITLTFNSAACGISTVTETFEINEPVTLDSVSIEPLVAGVPGVPPCVPAVIELNSGASGLNVGYEWEIAGDPFGYVFTAGTDSSDQNAQVEFIEPGSYTLSLNAFNLCDTIVFDTTLVFNGPPDALLTPIGPFCETAVLNFDALNTFYTTNGSSINTYTWDFPGAIPATSVDIFPTGISYDNPGTYTVSVTVSNDCGSSTHSVDFDIQQPQTINLDGDFEACVNGDSLVLNANPGGGSWSGIGVETNTGIFFPSQAGLGTSELIYSFGVGACNTQDTLNITVVDQPVLNLPFPTLCIDDLPVDLNSATSTSGSWTTTSNGLSDSSFDPSLAGVGFHEFVFEDSTTSCNNTATLEVLPLPMVSTPNDTVFCNIDFSIFLPEGSPVGGDYQGPGVNNNGNRFNPVTAGGIGSYIITYVYTDPLTGCTGAAPMTIDVTALENADAGPNETVCLLDDPFLPIDNNVASGNWTGSGIVDSTGLFDPQFAGVGIHVLTYTIGDGLCETNDTKTVEVLPAPEVDLMMPPICIDATDINLNNGVLEAGSWTTTSSGLSDSLFNPATAGTGIHVFQFTTLSTGCPNSDSLEIVPLPNILVGDTSVCNSIDIINLPFVTPSNGTWTGPAINGTTFDPQDAGGVGIYAANYMVIDSNGCSSNENIVIDVFQPDYLEAGPDEIICVDQGPTLLSGFDPVAGGGIWSGNGIVNPAGVFDPTFTGPGTFELTFTLDTIGCVIQDTKFVEVVEIQIQGGPDQTFCEGVEPFILQDFSPNGGIWAGPGIQSPGSYVFDPDLAGVGIHELTYSFTDPISGCTATATRFMRIDPKPVPGFTGPTESCVGVNNLFLNTSTNFSSTFWTFGDGSSSTLDAPINAYFVPGTYEINLTIGNGFGCVDSIKQDIFITEPPTAFFDPDTTQGCSNVPVLIQNFSDGFEASYFWDFGNGQQDTVYQPNLITYPPGTQDTLYVITLDVTNVCGTVSHTDSILVQPVPTANFSPDIDDGCTPLEVSFVNQSIGNSEDFFWDLGNGMIWNDSVPPPTTYIADSVDTEYIVTLISSNECGTDTAFHVITVFPPNVDVFTFADTTAGCEPLTVNFTSFSTPGAVISWDFGDGGTSDETNPSHTFDEDGIFEVIQFASNGCGYDSTILEITVLPEPNVEFTNPPFVCLGQPVMFTNISPDIVASSWDFGDGSMSTDFSPSHIFTEVGIYTVTLTGNNISNACPGSFTSTIEVIGNPVAAFATPDTDGCIPVTLSFINQSVGGSFFSWDFGDGNTSTEVNPDHTYSDPGIYIVTLVATDINGCFEDSSVVNIQAYPLPDVNFTFEIEEDCGLPATVTFTNQSLGASGFEWDFGNGETSLLNNPTVNYEMAGEYLVTLVGENAFGCKDSMEVILPFFDAPLSSFSMPPQEGCQPVIVPFNSDVLFADAVLWDFGDGITSEEFNPVHVYDEPGIYDVSLIATFQGMCSDTFTLPGLVRVLSTPTAAFTYEELVDPVAAGIFQFTNMSQGANQFAWDFGDGETSDAVSPSHRYFENAEYFIELIAMASNGCSDTATAIISPEGLSGLFIPNAFSPEAGRGDVTLFKPAGAGLREYRIEVYSPWGKLLWSSEALENGQPAEAWDGRYNGVLLPQDVYVWKAFGIFDDGSPWAGMPDRNGRKSRVGSLTLLR